MQIAKVSSSSINELLDSSILQNFCLGIGINYGQIANNLPSPSQVVHLVGSMSVDKLKLYDADPNVLTAFSNSNVEFIVGVGNEYLLNMTDGNKALAWIKEHIQPYLPQTRITCINVGNEVFSSNDTSFVPYLLPAMQTMHEALVSLGLDKQVNITTAHSLSILANSYPPSSGSFRPDLAQYLQPILNFHSQIKSPFLINAYPYFAYKANPSGVSLDYVLFRPNSGTTDPNTNLNYNNMLYAQIDSVYSAIKAMGHSDVEIRISETGWPSRGDSDEPGATPENAGTYNRNLLQRIAKGEGTPLKPDVPIDIYVFALFNEDLKPGPTSERNYGLFYPDGTPVYDIGLRGYLPQFSSASITKASNVCSGWFSYLDSALNDLSFKEESKIPSTTGQKGIIYRGLIAHSPGYLLFYQEENSR
ncbi:hypothetical protein ACLOJK_005833 [Asimina triloba]